MKLALQIAAGLVIGTLSRWVLSLRLVGAAANRVGGEVTNMLEQQTARAAARQFLASRGITDIRPLYGARAMPARSVARVTQLTRAAANDAGGVTQQRPAGAAA